MRVRSVWRGVAALALLLGACSDDASTPTTTTAVDLEALLLTSDDLPDGFAVAHESADTVTTFCVGQDATKGLKAADRALVTFRRTPKGAGIVQVVFRFKGAGAPTFVAQATKLFQSCHEVPDAAGLAFSYAPAAEAVEDALASTTSHVARNGTSVGSGSLQSTTVVFQVGDDIAELVGVLGVDQPRAELDELAATAVAAAVAKAQ